MPSAPKPRRFCSVPECGRIHDRKGYCKSHAHRFERYGDPLKSGYPRRARFIDAHGYVITNHRKREHRVVWERAFGPIPEGFEIHHVNGVKSDNRLENLQLLSRADHRRLHNAGRPLPHQRD